MSSSDVEEGIVEEGRVRGISVANQPQLEPSLNNQNLRLSKTRITIDIIENTELYVLLVIKLKYYYRVILLSFFGS